MKHILFFLLCIGFEFAALVLGMTFSPWIALWCQPFAGTAFFLSVAIQD